MDTIAVQHAQMRTQVSNFEGTVPADTHTSHPAAHPRCLPYGRNPMSRITTTTHGPNAGTVRITLHSSCQTHHTFILPLVFAEICMATIAQQLSQMDAQVLNFGGMVPADTSTCHPAAHPRCLIRRSLISRITTTVQTSIPSRVASGTVRIS